MTANEIVAELKGLGSESIKKVLRNHGVREPFFGVKVGDLKTLQKKIKRDHTLALELFDTGNSEPHTTSQSDGTRASSAYPP